MKKFMVVHRDPNITWQDVEANWAKSAAVESPTWIRTYYNKKRGVRYCVWLAPDEATLKSTFKDLKVAFETLIDVEETVPDLWGESWKKHLSKESKSDTLAF